MRQYEATAREVFGGWEVTVAGVPAATFRHRNPTEEVVNEKLTAALGRTDFRVRLLGLKPDEA